jgi:ubiquinone/menaquinone biosynthesis C-methylase UbiE
MYPKTFGRFVEPSAAVTHFHLKPGDSVADFGAGSGHYMKPLSDAVGTSGKVYLCEIQKNLVDALTVRAHELRLANIHPVWCDLEAENSMKLKDASLDAGLLSNTLFQLTDKPKALKEIARVIRKGGKLFVIDWTDSFGGLGPHPKDVIREADAAALLSAAGFTVERTFPAGDHHYGLACRRE